MLRQWKSGTSAGSAERRFQLHSNSLHQDLRYIVHLPWAL